MLGVTGTGTVGPEPPVVMLGVQGTTELQGGTGRRYGLRGTLGGTVAVMLTVPLGIPRAPSSPAHAFRSSRVMLMFKQRCAAEPRSRVRESQLFDQSQVDLHRSGFRRLQKAVLVAIDGGRASFGSARPEHADCRSFEKLIDDELRLG